jgi:outer membrane protein OmpA-like peptidoglycan-associated protein
MKTLRAFSTLIAAAAATLLIASCSAGPPPAEIAQARLAVQEAKNAGADQRATRLYDAAVAHLNVAQSTWEQQKDAVGAAHFARLAEGEARDAQYRAQRAQLSEELRREQERRARGEIAVRDAEIAALQGQARAEAEKRAMEAEARARAEAEARAQAERARLEGELAAQEAQAKETERLRAEAEARLAGEREKAQRDAAQAERDRLDAELARMRTELEASRAAAEQAKKEAEAERMRLEESRKAEEARAAEIARLREEQEKTREEMRASLAKLAEVREDARGLVVTLPGSIYFEVNKSDVKPAMRTRLTQIAKALSAMPEQRVLVEGHTDADGTDDYNMKLSQSRAESVRSVLLAGGLDANRVEAHGYGETKPVASNTNASGKAQNRRVELVLEGSAAQP